QTCALPIFARLHRFGQLPGNHLLDGLRLRLLVSPLLLEQIIQAAPDMGILRLTHSFTSFMRLRVNFKSLNGVFGVFLINPCSVTKVSWCAQKNTRRCDFPAGCCALPKAPAPLAGTMASLPATAISPA